MLNAEKLGNNSFQSPIFNLDEVERPIINLQGFESPFKAGKGSKNSANKKRFKLAELNQL